MMKKQLLIITLMVVSDFLGTAYAQGLKDIRINEVLVNTRSSYVDDPGNHVGWIELHNTGYASVNVSGAYLTVKRGDATKTYRIPKNDARTLIAPQGYVIFFADSTSNRGTFHTNFVLDETGYLAFMDQGKNVMDSIVYDVQAQQPDVSIGWANHVDTGELTFGPLAGITPMQANETEEIMPAAEKFRLRDPSGVVMAITAMSVVFSALILLYLIFKFIGKSMVRSSLKKEKQAVADMPAHVQNSGKADSQLIGEAIAAIAIALRQYENDMHDIESHVLTINRVARAYSPWSSKIYGLNNQPVRK